MQNTSIWIQVISAIATVVVAVIAFIIQQNISEQDQAIQRQIAKQEQDRAAVSRSVALYRDHVSSNSVRHLRSIAHKIDHHLWSSNLPASEEADEAVKVFNNEEIVGNIGTIRHAVAELLQDIRVVFHCGQFSKAEDAKASNEEGLCDRHTTSVLMGSIITEIFVNFKPILYCDKFVKGRYYEGGKSTGYVGNYETLVRQHMDLDFERRKIEWMVFLTTQEHKAAVDEGKLNADSKHWSVLRLPEERCKHYLNEE